jgi:hypothetical protein
MMRPPLLTTLIGFVLLTVSSALAQATGSGTGAGSTGPGPWYGSRCWSGGWPCWDMDLRLLCVTYSQDKVTKEVGLSVTQRKSVPPRAGGLLCGAASA